MTIKLEVGKTYRTRDGSAEHTIDSIRHDVAYSGVHGAWWLETGLRVRDKLNATDLVEEVTSSPVRQHTVTRTEIIPGIYGRAHIDLAMTGDSHIGTGEVWFGVTSDNPYHKTTLGAVNAEELDQIAATATQLAAALRAIAAEKGTDQ